jgi:hypothetical protein
MFEALINLLSIRMRKYLAPIGMLLLTGLSSCSNNTTPNPPSNNLLQPVTAYTASSFTATWSDISTTGIPFAYANPDTGHGAFPLPFDFPYDGKTIPAGSIVTALTKGDISLTGIMGDPHIPALANPNDPGMVCPFNGNFIAGKGHGIDTEHYQVDGVAPNRVLTVEFHNLHFSGDGSGGGTGGTGAGNFIPFQVKFYETSGIIEFIYSEHDSSFLGKIPLPGPPADTISVGLNGMSTPFTYNIYATKLNATPAHDIRWTP